MNKIVATDLTQTVDFSNIRGSFYQNGIIRYRLHAQQGQIDQQSKFIQLQGPIVLEDVRHQYQVKSQNIQWHPQTGQLMAQTDVILEHPQIKIQGQRLQASTQTHQAKIIGEVTMTLPEQGVQLQADQITWLPQMQTTQARGNQTTAPTLRPIPQRSRSFSWQQAQAQQMDLDLQSQQLLLTGAVAIALNQPQMQLNSQKVIMHLGEQQWHSPHLLQVQYQGITATALQGWLDLPQQQIQLQDQVKIKGLPHQARLQTQKLTWHLLTQQLEAKDNVVYQQHSPWISLIGSRAMANIDHQTLEVHGATVRAEILP